MGMIPSPAAYEIYRGEPIRFPNDKAFLYLLAGNGIWKAAKNRHMLAFVPVARVQVPGLPVLSPLVVRDLYAPLPSSLLDYILQDARRQAWDAPREAMYHIRESRHGVVSITRPDQTGTAAHLAYGGGGDEDIVADVHSHCEMGTAFSGTDNRDEGGFRFYVVIGKIFTRPEIRLRVGIYGHHHEFPMTALFDGPGPFVDANSVEEL